MNTETIVPPAKTTDTAIRTLTSAPTAEMQKIMEAMTTAMREKSTAMGTTPQQDPTEAEILLNLLNESSQVSTDIDTDRSSQITAHQFEYLYTNFLKYLKTQDVVRLPNRTEFKGVLVLLGGGMDRSSVSTMLEHLKHEWELVKQV